MTYNVCSRESKDKKKIQTEGRQWADRITWRTERLRGIRLYVFTQKRKNQKRRRIAEKIQVTILGDSERVRSWATGWRFYGEVNSRALSIGFFLSFLGFCLFQELVIFIELRWGLKQTSASHLCETRKERKLKWKQWVILKACCCIYFLLLFSPMCSKRGRLSVMAVLLGHWRVCHLKVESNVPSFKNKKNKFWRRVQYIIRSKTSVERIKLLVFLSVWLELWAFVSDVHIGAVISK
jgi:hypothetical protein